MRGGADSGAKGWKECGGGAVWTGEVDMRVETTLPVPVASKVWILTDVDDAQNSTLVGT